MLQVVSQLLFHHSVMECLTIEIKVERSNNVLISCIYRRPGSRIDRCNEKISELYEKHGDQVILVCGDFSTDLLKSNDAAKTQNSFMSCLV